MSEQKLSLEQRLARMEDLEAIKQLKYQYAAYLDDKFNPEGIASLFTPDGLWAIKGVGGTVKGRDAIKQHCRNLLKGISWSQHCMMAPLTTIAPDGMSATGSFYLICLLTMTTPEDPNKEDAYVLAGTYKNKYVKVDGKWYFKELTGSIDQSAPWSDGWVKKPIKKEEW